MQLRKGLWRVINGGGLYPGNGGGSWNEKLFRNMLQEYLKHRNKSSSFQFKRSGTHIWGPGEVLSEVIFC